ncbi:XrtA system polysaccharide chain length determinant [Thiocystis violacea]|uniref:XrtA system polysaccharide chain length determinant n=1 Tax=Thiocystis violacea TaxID=13725 RepID=UPI001908BAF5|nr:XrtA system polysaccharide chain length determinant [Thiocystis violacea]MBK1722333.1 chain length-determining protein [Thiocystis violacea]
MHDLLLQLFSYVRGMWRYRWLALTVAWLIAISGWVYVSRLPDEYKASARVFVDTNSVLRPLLQGLAIQPDLVQRVALMSRMLLSRPNLERIARMSDLDLGVRTERDKELMLDQMLEKIQLAGDRSNPSLYRVSFEHRDPNRAKQVVQSLVTVFIEQALVGNDASTSTAHDFLEQEIADYESRLRQSEKELADFKRENAGVLPGEQVNYYTNLEQEKAALKDAELALREAIWRRDELGYQIESEDQIVQNNFDLTPLQQAEDPRIIAMQTKLDELLLRFTDRHPNVIQLRRQIDELRESNRQQLRTNGGSQLASNVPANTVYGNLRVALSEADTQVAALTARVGDYKKRVKQLGDKIDSIPTIEARLKQLTRNYSTIAAQHNELLKRRESARLSTEVEKTVDGAKFRVVDPPFAPSKPSAPNRLALSAAVLLIAIGGGLASALGMDLLRPIYDERHILYQETGIPVLGSVGLVMSSAQRRRERLMLIPFVAASASLVVGFILVAKGLPMLLGQV